MNHVKRKLAGGLALGALLGLGIVPAAIAASQVHKAAAKPVFPRRGAAFVGVSSQKSGKLALPVDLRASANGRLMSRFDIQWAASCQSTAGRGSYGGLSITLNKAITAPGVFSDTGSFSRMFSNGDKGQFTIKLFGRFSSPTRAAGTFRVQVAITDSAGASTDNCDSGVVNWVVTD
ncbi:MAG: hypothetical protein ACR2KV_17430 [Solirubrobacteraceae bacterium]